ncbi:MAG: phytanoyl-CoA dioxygenase family protein [bacterium]
MLGPDLYIWGATLFAIPPYSGGYVGWHQDLRYWGLTPCDEVLTAWHAISDAHRDNGCMAVLPGSP